ncbi:MAG: GNAT family N-acetyltransferase, partial [Nocardioides sp.]
SYLPQRGDLRDAWVGTLLRNDPREPTAPWLVPPPIEADGLRLRPFADRDVPRIVEGSADPRTSGWLGQLLVPYTEADAADYLESVALRHATNAGITWAVADSTDDVLLGSVGVFDHTPGIECEVGYWTHPDARGRGVASRAVAMALRHCFTALGVNRVKALCAADNAASRHVLEVNGLTHTGVERLGAHVRDGYADAALYDVLASEFSVRT